MRGERGRRTGRFALPEALAVSAVALVVVVMALAAPTIDAAARSSAATTALDATPVIGAVGDFACDPSDPKFNGGAGTSAGCAQNRVSSLMVADGSLVAVLGLGDFQYDCGDPSDYAVSYNPTWGRLDPLMRPVAGNHEYKTGQDLFGRACPSDNATAHNYFARFGAAAHAATGGHFSFDVGSWHLIGLNSNCSKSGVGGCGATGAQTTWLQQDLAATTQPCVAAFWHQPLFTGAKFGGAAYRPWWNALYAAHADVVLNGHVHNYQRYAALNPAGTRDAANGITEYVVGTGGEGFTKFIPTVKPQPLVHRQSFGYLRMTLGSSGWSAEFVDASGTVTDTSSGTCHA